MSKRYFFLYTCCYYSYFTKLIMTVTKILIHTARLYLSHLSYLALNSPIEETKYVSLHQQTISESFVEEDDVPLRNFYLTHNQNIQNSKTLDEESKHNDESKAEAKSFRQLKLDDGLFEKIDSHIDEGRIDLSDHLKCNDSDMNDNTFVFPNLDSARLRRNRLQPLKKDFFCTQKTEIELTPQIASSKRIMLLSSLDSHFCWF